MRILSTLGLLTAVILALAPDASACGPFCDMPGDRGGVPHYIDNAVACEAACDRTQSCRGWTWVKPGVQGPQAVCWLKSEIVRTMQSNCCISGYRGDRSATASVRKFNFEVGPRHAPPPPAPAPTQGAGSPNLGEYRCDCRDERGTPYRGMLGQGCGGARSYACKP